MAYIKSHSNYVLKKKHQNLTNGGSVFERDITTIGGLNQFAPGQKPIYRSGNFIITVNKDLSLTKEYGSSDWVKNGDADGEVAGAMNATSNVLRPALQIIKMKKGISVVSGAFIMITPTRYGNNGVLLFADCAVTPNPDANQLAQIAVSTADTARVLVQMEPKVAMLSFSTKGSAKNESPDKVIEATRIAKEMEPTLIIDGEFQADAAIVASVGAQKAPDSPIKGDANVLVFPTLDAGNIGYKLTQRFSGGVAIGPILQGMASPVNDLSRGCTVEDIVKMVVITANQSM